MPEIPIVAIIFGVFGWIVWVIATNIRRSKTAREVADLHAKLLDRCAANQDILRYIESEPGRRFLESATVGQAAPHTRILNAVQAGAILALAGAAILIVRGIEESMDVRDFLAFLGAVLAAIGVGFLISAAVSYGLCRSWGLLNTAEDRR
jgi:hypothetical protein